MQEEDPLLEEESDVETWSEGDYDSDFGVGGGVTELPRFEQPQLMTSWEDDPDPLLHGGEDPLLAEDLSDIYAGYAAFDPLGGFNSDTLDLEVMGTTPLFLAAAANQYLDTTVTKFLENDISVTKFLEKANDTTITKFLDTTVTKFLESNDITVTKFMSAQNDDSDVAKYLEDTLITTFLESDDAPVSKYLEHAVLQNLDSATARFLESNDVTVTKFLETALANFLLDDKLVSQFLEENDISVTKFMDSQPNDTTVTKFLNLRANDTTVTKFLDGDDNDISVTKFMDTTVTKFLQ